MPASIGVWYAMYNRPITTKLCHSINSNDTSSPKVSVMLSPLLTCSMLRYGHNDDLSAALCCLSKHAPFMYLLPGDVTTQIQTPYMTRTALR